MAKAMLIMDMPSCCGKCPCAYITEKEEMCLAMDITTIDVDVEAEKPTWCPLREVPEKKEILKNEQYLFGSLGRAFVDGYNACIDEILGGGE